MNRFCSLALGLLLAVCLANPNGTLVYSQERAAFQNPRLLGQSSLGPNEEANRVDAIDQQRENGSTSGSSLSDLLRDRNGDRNVGELSKLLRNRADELGEDEPTESLESESRMDEDADEEGEDDEKDQEYSRSLSTVAHLMRLRKPIREIRIGEIEPGERVPENKAGIYSQPKPLIMISALGADVLRPNRYTVCAMHQPLYYEQPNLERCGNGCGYFQNAISGIEFVANTMTLPYQLGQQCPDCLVPSGGDCLTCQSWPVDLNPFPLDWRGLVIESAAVAGFTFLLL